MKKLPALALALALLLCGCAVENPAPPPEPSATPAPTAMPEEIFVDEAPLDAESAELEEEAAAFVETPPPPPQVPEAVASGVLQSTTDRSIIDYSNTGDGYIMLQYTQETQLRLKAQLSGPGGTTYTYDLSPCRWAVLPLSDGSGDFRVTVYENVYDSKYAAVAALGFSVQLADEFAPFLRPNQYVNYSASSAAVAQASQLLAGEDQLLKKVEKVYNFTVNTLSYDKEKAQTVKSGYLPDLDAVLAEGRGICFDYAALMTGMLRSQGIPCKLVVGYAGSSYHAWISVWSEETGWVDGAIFFDGSAWQRMDPTFASSGEKSEDIMRFIGDGSNYSEKYLY